MKLLLYQKKNDSLNLLQETPGPLNQRDEDEWTLGTDSQNELDADQDLISPMFEIHHLGRERTLDQQSKHIEDKSTRDSYQQ